MSKKFVLYRSKPDQGFWLTEAFISDEGALSICSGDANAEWYIKVPPNRLPALRLALHRRTGTAHESSDADAKVGAPGEIDEVINLLMESFGNRESNPFEEIKQFLNASKIPWKHDFWGSL